jgi:hypothetical protein
MNTTQVQLNRDEKSWKKRIYRTSNMYWYLRLVTHVYAVFFGRRLLLITFHSILLQILDFGLARVLSDDDYTTYVATRYINNPIFLSFINYVWLDGGVLQKFILMRNIIRKNLIYGRLVASWLNLSYSARSFVVQITWTS